MRERLIELIQDSVGGCARHWAEVIADYLLANGVIVPPCKVGDTFYGVNGTSYDTYYAYEFKWGKRNGDGDYVLTLITVYDMEFIWGEEAFLTKEEAENALKARERE